jgi:4-hydroxybenzoate polyprenyltransferase
MKQKLHLKSSLSSFLKLIRFGNLIILALTQYTTAIFLIGPADNWVMFVKDWRLFLIVLSTFCIAAAGYIINDSYDIKIDIINKPKRVIVGKLLTRRIAIFSHTLLNFLGIILGFIVSWKVAALNLLVGFNLWLYSNSLKRLPLIGNIAVALLTSLSILIVALYYHKNIPLVIVFSVFAFFISLVREIIKDMEDIKGDLAFGCKTLPLVYGIRKTKNVLYILIASFFISLVLLATEVNQNLVIYFSIFILIPLSFLIYKLMVSDSSKDFRFLSKLCKVIMLLGVISMIFI